MSSRNSFDFSSGFRDIMQNAERMDRFTIQAIAEEVKDWAFMKFHDMVDDTPLDTGDLRESMTVDINNQRLNYVLQSNDERTNVRELDVEVTWQQIIREGAIIIVFSANKVYAHYQHEGINLRTGQPLNYQEPNAKPKFITRHLDNVDDLLSRLELRVRRR